VPQDEGLPPGLEQARFAHLKARLADLWSDAAPSEDEPYTSVVVPSLTLEPAELARVPGVIYYEERLLFFLIRLRNPQARLVYVTSQPLHPLIVEYYLQLLVGVPASHARSRLTLLSTYDSSARPLTQKILERPRLLARLRAAIGNPERAYLTVFNATPLERRLAVQLGIPLNATDPELVHRLGTKSGARKLFRSAGVPHPDGAEDLHAEAEITDALVDLRGRHPTLAQAVIKLDDGFGGEGNALFTYPPEGGREPARVALQRLQLSGVGPGVCPEAFLVQMARRGGVVEELLGTATRSSPSVQIRINPLAECFVTSTHEQVLGGPIGQSYVGCLFPAGDAYRRTLQELGQRAGRALAEQGVVGRLSVDFVAWREQREWNLAAVEINLRMGGTTHPMLALRLLTGGTLDRESGLFHTPRGRTKFYRASDQVASAAYRGLLPDDVVEIVTLNRLDYNQRTETGVLFHMIGAVSEHGKLGLLAIGDSRAEADEVYARTVGLLDREAAHPARR
jgi:PGM1 C-terminal domain